MSSDDLKLLKVLCTHLFVLSALHPHLTRIYASQELKLCLCSLLYPQDLEQELRLSRQSSEYLSEFTKGQASQIPRMVKNLPANARCNRCGFNSWVGKIPWSRKWQPTSVFLPGKSHRQRSPAGYSPRGHKDSDTTQ